MQRAITKAVKVLVVCIVCVGLLTALCPQWYYLPLLCLPNRVLVWNPSPEAHYLGLMESCYMISGSKCRGTVPEMLKDIEKSLCMQGVPVLFITTDVPPTTCNIYFEPPDGANIRLYFEDLMAFEQLAFSASSDGTFVFRKCNAN